MHPDGRLQRLRTAIAHPGEVRAGWSVIAEVAKRAGLDIGVLTRAMAFEQLVEAVPFYAGLTLEEIGGRGVRWPEREAASAMPDAARTPASAARPSQAAPARRPANGAPAPRHLPLDLGLARGRDLARAPVHDRPASRSSSRPQDAQRLGIAQGRGGRGRAERDAAERDAPRSAPASRPAPRSSPTGIADGLGQRAHRAARRGQQAMIAFADVNYFEPWWVQIIKSIVIFAVVFAILPMLIVYERKLLGRFQARYGPNRVGPVRAACSRWRRSSSSRRRSRSGRRRRSASCSGSRR